MGRPRELSPEERERLLRRGYRPIEVWVPDPTNPSYLEDALRQAANSVLADEKAGIGELHDSTAFEDWDRP